MDILELVEKAAEAGRIKEIRVKDIKTSARQYVKLLGYEDTIRCPESIYAIPEGRRKEVIEDGLPDASLVKVRNTKNNLSFLFRNAEELGLIRLSTTEPLKKRAVQVLSGDLPSLGLNNKKRGEYRLRTKDWPEKIQAECKKWEYWSTAAYVPGRSTKLRQRPESVRMKQDAFSRLAGYLVNIQGREFNSMLDLIDPELVQEFTSWYVDSEEGEVTRTLTMDIGSLATVARHYFKDEAIANAIRTIKTELGTPTPRKIKDSRRVSVTELISAGKSEFPDKSALNRRDMKSNNPGSHIAIQAARGLAIMLMATRPLRQKNFREALLGKHIKKEGGHWVLSFSGEEKDPASLKRKMRNGQLNVYKTTVPDFLVPYLEQYLEVWRPILNTKESDHLFLTLNGNPYEQILFGDWIQRGTLKWLGKRVNPHLFRDIVATEVINETGDYVAAATLLNDDPTTVFKHYWHLNQEKAARTIDDWLAKKMGGTVSEAPPSPESEVVPEVPTITREPSLSVVTEERGDEASSDQGDAEGQTDVEEKTITTCDSIQVVKPRKTRNRARSTEVQTALEKVANHLAQGKSKKDVSELCQRYRIWANTADGEVKVGKHGSHKVLVSLPLAA